MKNLKKKNVSILFSIIVFLVVSFALPSPVHGLNENLASNIDGKIQTIIFHNGDGSYLTGLWFDMSVVFRDLMDKMDKDVGFVILVGKDYKADKLKEKLKPYAAQKLPDGTARVKYLTVDVKTSSFYPWARDGYFVLTDENKDLIFVDAGFGYKPFPITNFSEIFATSRSRAGKVNRGGGNIRTTNEEIFMGIDTILGIDITPIWDLNLAGDQTIYSVIYNLRAMEALAKELAAKKPTKNDSKEIASKKEKAGAKILSRLKNKFDIYANQIHYVLAPDKKLVIPGKERFFSQLAKGEYDFTNGLWRSTGAQAAYHTDVYLSLGPLDKDDKRIVFIADTKAGAAIVEKMSPAERRAVERKMPAVLESEGFSAGSIPVTKEQIAKRFEWEKHKMLDLGLKAAARQAETLDATAKHLEKLGYRVYRVPYFPNGLNNHDDKSDEFSGLSYNYSNVLTEVYGNVKKVYMPTFGFKQLDEAAAKAYEQAGFKVIYINGLLTNALTVGPAGAGLDCLTSDIRVPVRWVKE
ncbi:MAG: hypothetical protein GY765_43770, partial [bacterium]|nr:hypothetical protein [bacterium]